MLSNIKKLAGTATLLAVASMQVGCNGTQAGAIVGGIAGAAIGSENGAKGAIVGGAIGAAIGAAYGTLLDNEPYYYYDSYGYRRSYVVTTYEVRERRYIPHHPHGYVVRTEYIYVERYRRHVHVHRWYRGDRCERQYYVTEVYDSEKNAIAEQLDPTVSANVARSAKNLGLPERTTEALLAKEYEAVVTNNAKPVMAVFANEFKDSASRKALARVFETGKVEKNEAFTAKVAKSLSSLADEEITSEMATSFIEATAKAAKF